VAYYPAIILEFDSGGDDMTVQTNVLAYLAQLPAHYEHDQAWAIKGYANAADRYTLLSPNVMTVNINGLGYVLGSQTEISLATAANWDTTTPTDYTVAANRAGLTFYVYACVPTSGVAPTLLVSPTATAPYGYTTSNSRRVLTFRCFGTASTGFSQGDINPDSLWGIKDDLFVRQYGRVNDIGTPGTAGFGVGICPPSILASWLTPMEGCYSKTHANYGNYQSTDGSIMCWVPSSITKFGTGTNGLAVNVIDVKSIYAFADTTAANAAGYALHRMFIDGGVEQPGVMVDKYKFSKLARGTGYVAASVKNGNPLSTHAGHNPISEITAVTHGNIYASMLQAPKGRLNANGVAESSPLFCCSRFIHGGLALLSLSHGQAVSSTANCAWYQSGKNYPKGCNNDALRDVDDTTVLYTSDGYLNCGKTGSGAVFAKTTHNGQDCGIADLNGLMFEVSIGVTCVATTANIEGMSQAAACEITWTGHGMSNGDIVVILGITQADWSAANDKLWPITKTGDNTFTIPFNSSGFGTPYDAGTDPGTVTKGTFYAAKTATAMKDFTAGTTLATDHWGATGIAAMMDSFVPPFKTTGGVAFSQRYGSGGNQVLSEATSGAGYLLTGLGFPKDGAAIDGTGTDTFGNDYYYQYIKNQLCLISCSSWSSGAAAGVWYAYWGFARSDSSGNAGGRAACYLV